MSGLPDPRPARRVSRSQATRMHPAEQRRAWKEAVLERDGHACAVHGNPVDCRWPHRCHHVVLAQLLRQTHPWALYDRRAGMTVCDRAHDEHHDWTRPIFLDEIPAECVTFARDVLGYGDWIERRYPARFLTHTDPADETAAA